MSNQGTTQPKDVEKPEVLVDGYGGTTPAPAERGVSPAEGRPHPDAPVVNRHEPEAGSPEDDATNTVMNSGPLS